MTQSARWENIVCKKVANPYAKSVKIASIIITNKKTLEDLVLVVVLNVDHAYQVYRDCCIKMRPES